MIKIIFFGGGHNGHYISWGNYPKRNVIITYFRIQVILNSTRTRKHLYQSQALIQM